FVNASAAQGVQTGAIRGVVKDAGGQLVPHAAIRAESSALMGGRATVSDEAGAYQFASLAPGEYKITFELDGFQAVISNVRVGLGSIERLDVTMRPTMTETVTVTASTPSLLTRRGGGSNVRMSEIEKLPTGRTPSLVAELAPGLTNNTPNVNQVTISGAVAYD